MISHPTVVIDSDYPGGNIIVRSIEADTIRLDPDLRDTQGDWFYWNFRVRGAAGRTLRFEMHKGTVGLLGPAVSQDGGMTWRWLGRQTGTGDSFIYTFGANDGEVRFCDVIPYIQADLDRFLKAHAGNPCLRREVLCKTPKGKEVELLRAGRLDGQAPYRLLLTCRHHACESTASYVLEGIIEGVLSDTPEGQWLRQNLDVAGVPMVDKDGVQDGDQGKNRKPHDHNRDYGDEPIYPSVKAIKAWTPQWANGQLDVAMDLHSPGLKRDYIYFFGSPNIADWPEVRRFLAEFDKTRQGPLVRLDEDDMPLGTKWNTEGYYKEGKGFLVWATTLPCRRFAVAVEVPYAVARGRTVTAESARAFGHDLARAFQRYLAAGGANGTATPLRPALSTESPTANGHPK